MTSDFILNYLKKVIGGATTQKNLKTNTKTMISSIWMRPQGPQGCQKKLHHPLNKLMKKIWKTVRKQAFLMIFFQFSHFFTLFLILAQELNSFICEKKIWSYDTPGTPGGASIWIWIKIVSDTTVCYCLFLYLVFCRFF